MKLFSTLPILLVLVAATLAAQPRTEEPRPLARAVRSATALVASGNYSLALAELEPALDSAATGEPTETALVLLTLINYQMQRYPQAVESAKRLFADYRLNGRHTGTLYREGVAAYELGDTDLAMQSLQAVGGLGTMGPDGDPNYWIARIYAEHGRLDSAEHYATIAASPINDVTDSSAGPLYRDMATDAMYLLGWIRETRGETDSAAPFYRTVLDRDPNGDLALDAQLRLGVIDARRGNYEPAMRLLTSLTPRSSRQREEQTFYLGEMSAALNRYDDALRYNTEYLRQFPTSPRTRQVRYAIGWAQLNLGKQDEAITTFRGLENDIDSIAAASAYQIGAIQMMRGDTANALRSFESLVDRMPYESFSDNAYYQLGRIFYRRAAYDSARHYLLITARQFPESEVRADAYYLLGESYGALNDPTNAQYAFSRARKVGATGGLYERSLYREGVMLYKVGRFRSAIDRLREYVSEHPNGEQAADATFWLGEALYQDRTYDEAERYYNAYLEKFKAGPWREDALYGLAWSRFQQKDFKGAALAFGDFIEKNPTSRLSVEATIRQADAYRLMGDYQKAISTYESIGKLTGKGARDEEARFQLARVFLQMDEIDRAVGTFRQLIADYPGSAYRDVYAFNIGSIYHEKGMDTLAIAELTPFPENYPSSQYVPEALFIVGNSYYNLEAYDTAMVYYRRVLDQYPNSAIVPEALDAIKFSLNGLGRGLEAVAIIDSFQTRNPNRIPADSLNFRKAMIIVDQGNFAEAITLFEKLAADFPQSPLAAEALVQIGHAYENLQKPDSALVAYRQAIERYPGSVAAGTALIEGASIRLDATQWADAADAYTTYLAQYHDSERVNEARYGIAVARLGMKDTAAALAQLETVLDSGATNEEDLFLDKSRIVTARIMAAQGRSDRAIDLLASVVARRMDDVAAEALLYRSELLARANDLSTALSELRRLTTDFASFPEYAEPGMLLLGRVYENLTNYASARETYNQLIAQTQDPALKKEAEARLKKLKK